MQDEGKGEKESACFLMWVRSVDVPGLLWRGGSDGLEGLAGGMVFRGTCG